MICGRGGFKDEYQKDIYLKDIELGVQNMITIRGSIINIIEGRVCPFNEHESLHFGNGYDINVSSCNHEESDFGLDFRLPSHTNRVLYILGELGYLEKIFILNPFTL